MTGAYSAERAAALSGVPKSTVYYWAKQGHLVPSISQTSLMLWSYTDLLGLRTIYWLRQPKKRFDREIPPTSMSKVRHAMAQLRKLEVAIIEAGKPVLAVNLAGDVLLDRPAEPLQLVDGQIVERELVDVVAQFEAIEGGRGPHLAEPRPLLRIVPKKLGGAPHVRSTRVETEGLFALRQRELTTEQIGKLYPFLVPEAIEQSIDLESQLQKNLAIRRAA